MSLLQRPLWIPIVSGAAARPRFAWDEWDVMAAYRPGNADVQARMSALSLRANMAMCTAVAEWVVWRFEDLSGDFRPALMLEAAWAAGVHHAYARYHEFDDDEWRGVVRGPIRIGLDITIDLIWGLKRVEPGRNVAWASQLAELVLPETGPFIAWRDLSIEKLALRFQVPQCDEAGAVFDDEIDLGPWVPREFFDPMRGVSEGEERVLIERFVASLDPRRNPYLHTPEEMRQFADYRGTPYRVDPSDG